MTNMSKSQNDAVLVTKENVIVGVEGRTASGTYEYAEKSGVIKLLKSLDSAVGSARTALLVKAADLLDKAKAITRRSGGKFTVENGVVLNEGVPVHNTVASRIVDFSNTGLPFRPLLRFLENLVLNVSNRAKEELYLFLEHKNMPITADGCFIAYKSVRSDYFSKASGNEPVQVSTDGGNTWKTFIGHIPNKVGSIVRMERNLVDDDRARTCSHGLHVGALSYSGPNGWYHNSGDKIVVVKVNPKNAVSVPSDHSATKLRVSEYEVIADFENAFEVPLTSATGNEFISDFDDF